MIRFVKFVPNSNSNQTTYLTPISTYISYLTPISPSLDWVSQVMAMQELGYLLNYDLPMNMGIKSLGLEQTHTWYFQILKPCI